MEILASNIHFSTASISLSSTKFVLQTLFKHTYSIVFLLNKNWFSTLLDIYELLNQLSFNIFIDHFRLQETYLQILSHALTHKYDAHDMF